MTNVTATRSLNDLLTRNDSLTVDDLLTSTPTHALAVVEATEALWRNTIRRLYGAKSRESRRLWQTRMVAAREAMLAARWSAATLAL